MGLVGCPTAAQIACNASIDLDADFRPQGHQGSVVRSDSTFSGAGDGGIACGKEDLCSAAENGSVSGGKGSCLALGVADDRALQNSFLQLRNLPHIVKVRTDTNSIDDDINCWLH